MNLIVAGGLYFVPRLVPKPLKSTRSSYVQSLRDSGERPMGFVRAGFRTLINKSFRFELELFRSEVSTRMLVALWFWWSSGMFVSLAWYGCSERDHCSP